MGFFDKIADLFRKENDDDNWKSPFSALIDDEDKAQLDQLNEIQRHYGMGPFTALLDDKTLDKLYRMKDRYNDPYKALNAEETVYDLNTRVKEKLSEELQKFRNVCQKVGTQNQQDTDDYMYFEKIRNYENKKYEIAQDLCNKSYPEMIDDVFWMIDEYPDLSPSADKKYFSRFRHDGNPLGIIKDYVLYPDELRRCGFNKDKWEEDYSKWKHQTLLDNPKTIPLAEVFATFLARKAIELQDLGSIRDCVRAYTHYNANRILENGFDAPVIVPQAFKNPHFKALLQKDGATDTFPLLEANTVRDWLLNMKKEKNLFNTPPLLQEDWEKIFDKWDFPEIQNSVCGVDNEVSIEEMKKHKALSKANAAGQVDGIFVDVDGTLILPNGLNKRLYEIMLLLKGTEKVTIFTGGDIALAKKHLQDIGVDINAFPIESKDNYRNFLFTGIIIDDVEPEHQAFWMNDEERYISERSVNLDFLKVAAQKRANGENKPLLTLFDEAKENLEGLNPLLRGMMERAKRRG